MYQCQVQKTKKEQFLLVKSRAAAGHVGQGTVQMLQHECQQRIVTGQARSIPSTEQQWCYSYFLTLRGAGERGRMWACLRRQRLVQHPFSPMSCLATYSPLKPLFLPLQQSNSSQATLLSNAGLGEPCTSILLFTSQLAFISQVKINSH